MSPDVDLDELLRRELAHRAATTRTSPTARADIHARAATAAGGSAPHRWRRPALALAVVLVLVVAAVRVLDRSSDEAPTPPVVQPLPSRPPVLEGRVLGEVVLPCGPGDDFSPDCGDGPGQLDLAQLSEPELLARRATVENVAGPVLSDGRVVHGDTSSTATARVVDPASGRFLPLPDHEGGDVVALPDGRVATLRPQDGRSIPVAVVDVISETGVERSVVLPDDFLAHTLATGPEGWIAVLGDRDRECCLNRAELVLVAPDGSLRRVDVRDALADRRVSMMGTVVSWSSRGLIAVSGARLEPGRTGDAFDWTVVVDPTTGERVADVDAVGTAWSPDGTGLLGVRRTGVPTAVDLVLFWGPGLRHETAVGTVPADFTPYWWLS